MLNFEHISVLLAIANSGSFSAAARQLGKSQGAISQTVQQMELELGFDLFDRRGARATLTPLGNRLCNRAWMVMRQVENFHGLSQQPLPSPTRRQRINLGLDRMVPLEFLESPLKALGAHFPEVGVSLVRDGFDRLKQRLLEDELHLIVFLARGYGLISAVSIDTFADMPFCFVCSPDHTLAQLEIVDELSLVSCRQICCDVVLENPLLHLMCQVSFDIWVASDQDDMLRLVEQGLGWALIPEVLYEAREPLGVLKRFVLDTVHCRVFFPVDMMRSTQAFPSAAQRFLESALARLPSSRMESP